MSTPSRSASSATRSAGRDRKPMMTALSTVARLTSFWVIAPTPRWMIRRSTSSPTSILSKASSSASTEPDTSPLRMRLRLSTLPAASASLRSSRLIRLRRLASQAAHHDRTRRRGLLDRVAVLVEHGADAAVATAGHDRVTDAQRSGLDQHRGDGATTLVEVSFDGNSAGVLVGIGSQIKGRVRAML